MLPPQYRVRAIQCPDIVSLRQAANRVVQYVDMEICDATEILRRLAGLEQELAELHRCVAGSWDNEAYFRFLCVKRAFKRRGCEILADRPALEFPHLSRDQLQAHDAHCDSLRFVSQRQTAAFRQWRRDRQQLLRRHGVALEARLRCEEEQRERRESAAEHQQKQRRCREQLEAERLAGSVRRWGERKNLDAQLREERDTEKRWSNAGAAASAVNVDVGDAAHRSSTGYV